MQLKKADDESLWDLSKEAPTGKKAAVIGAGPAGAQAAIDLSRYGHEVTIFEKLDIVGGMMRVGIPEYRLPRDIIDREYSYLNKLGVEFRFNTEIGKDITIEELKESFDVVILAHGAHVGSIIPIPGHDAEGVYSAAEYLKEISLKREFPQAGKKILVIGGGDVAMDCARSSWRIGAETVYQASLENDDEMPASKEEIIESKEEGVIFNPGWGPKEIIKENGKVSKIIIRKVLSIFDDEGKFSPKYSDETREIEADTVIFATGQKVEDITDGKLEQTFGGRYKVDRDTLSTSIDKVFVAGDAAGTNIVIQAMAYGRKSAISADRFMKGISLIEDRDLEKEYVWETKLDIPLPEGTEDLPRLSPNMRDPEERKRDFDQCDLGFGDIQAVKEASRCLSCECSSA